MPPFAKKTGHCCQGNPTKSPLFIIFELQSISSRCQQHKSNLGLHVNRPIFLLYFNQIWNIAIDFRGCLQYKI